MNSKPEPTDTTPREINTSDEVRITLPSGDRITGTVIKADNMNSARRDIAPNWYVELTMDADSAFGPGYGYWKQSSDGGTIEIITTEPTAADLDSIDADRTMADLTAEDPEYAASLRSQDQTWEETRTMSTDDTVWYDIIKHNTGEIIRNWRNLADAHTYAKHHATADNPLDVAQELPGRTVKILATYPTPPSSPIDAAAAPDLDTPLYDVTINRTGHDYKDGRVAACATTREHARIVAQAAVTHNAWMYDTYAASNPHVAHLWALDVNNQRAHDLPTESFYAPTPTSDVQHTDESDLAERREQARADYLELTRDEQPWNWPPFDPSDYPQSDRTGDPDDYADIDPQEQPEEYLDHEIRQAEALAREELTDNSENEPHLLIINADHGQTHQFPNAAEAIAMADAIMNQRNHYGKHMAEVYHRATGRLVYRIIRDVDHAPEYIIDKASDTHPPKADEKDISDASTPDKTLTLSTVQLVALDIVLIAHIEDTAGPAANRSNIELLQGIQRQIHAQLFPGQNIEPTQPLDAYTAPDIDSLVTQAIADLAHDKPSQPLTDALKPTLASLHNLTFEARRQADDLAASFNGKPGHSYDYTESCNRRDQLDYLLNQIRNAEHEAYSFTNAQAAISRLIDMAYMAGLFNADVLAAFNTDLWQALTAETNRQIDTH